MSLLHKLCDIVEDCRADLTYRSSCEPLWTFQERRRMDGAKKAKATGMGSEAVSWMQPGVQDAHPVRNRFLAENGAPAGNMLAAGDNAAFMEWLLRERQMAGKLKLIYIDPPFFSNADYAAEVKINTDKIRLSAVRQKAYRDTWENGMEEYLSMLAYRLLLMRELLAEDGGLWIHLDWHASHYVKVIADEIFGQENFINEVVWQYKSGGVSRRRFARKHDTLLYYGKSKHYFFKAQKEKSYNRGYKPYRFRGVKEYKDELGWYTMVNKKDVWQIDMVGRTSAERTGYATQKPEQLLRQILESCTEENDLCADFFCGSGTLPAAAKQLSRRWIACDSGRLAVEETEKRMWTAGDSFSVFEAVPADAAATLRKGEGAALPRRSAQLFHRRIQNSEGSLSAEVSVAQAGVSDRQILTVQLTGYVPPVAIYEMLDEKNAKTVKRIVKKDGLSLINYWFVDSSPQGDGILRPDQMMVRGKGGLELQFETLAEHFGGAQGEILIHASDVFGGRVTAVAAVKRTEE